MINLDKSWALVTGAGSGMGYCYARALAARRYNVLLVSNQDFIVEKAEQVQKDYGVQTIGLLRAQCRRRVVCLLPNKPYIGGGTD